MAEVFRVKCLSCGTPRAATAFGVDVATGTFDPSQAEHESGMAIVNIGGRGRCTWDKRALSLPLAYALRENLRNALNRLNEEIAQAESGG